MRAGAALAALLGVLLCPSPICAEPLVEVRPHERLAAPVFAIEYARPWAGLPVERSRSTLGIPVVAEFRSGVVGEWTITPSVTESGIGAWLGFADRVLVEWIRRSVEVEGFTRVQRDELFIGGAAHPGPWRFGASMELIDLAAGPRRTEEWWCGVEHGFAEILIRRTRPVWTGDALWTATVWISLGRRDGLGLSMAPSGSEFLFGWSTALGQVLARSTWSGARAGAFALRWAVR